MNEFELKPLPRTHEGERTRSKSGIWIVILLALPLLYVLSLGPVARLHSSTESAGLQNAIELFYIPLSYLIQLEIPGFAPALEWYINLFQE